MRGNLRVLILACALATCQGGCAPPDLESVYGPVAYFETPARITQAQLDAVILAWLVRMDDRGFDFEETKHTLRADPVTITFVAESFPCEVSDEMCDGVAHPRAREVRVKLAPGDCVATGSLAHELTHVLRHEETGAPHDWRFYYWYTSVQTLAAIDACEEACGRPCTREDVSRPDMVNK